MLVQSNLPLLCVGCLEKAFVDSKKLTITGQGLGIDGLVGLWAEMHISFSDEVNSVATSLRINFIDDFTEPIDHCAAAMLDDFVV